MRNEFIPRHRQLVYFLSQFEGYRTEEDKPLFKIRKKSLIENFHEELTPAQVDGAAEVLADVFNLLDPVIGLRFDLRKLLRAYMLDEGKRLEINKLLQFP